MKKLALQVETLHVDSFPTTQSENAARGTVQAHWTYWYEPSCGGPSCAVVCRTLNDTPCVEA